MKTRITRRRAVLIGGAVLVLAALVYSFLPQPLPVQTAVVTRGPLQVIVEEEGETEIDDRYVVTAPVAAFVRRIDLEPGDIVTAGQEIVRLEPPRSAILDPRTQSEAASRVTTARAALQQADIAAAQARAELERTERLYEAGAATRQALEQATAAAATALAARDAARAELAAAEAAQRSADGTARLPVQEVLRAPAAGRVLSVHQRSEGHVAPGQPLLEIGATERLRIGADVLSQDAVRIRPGTRVIVDQWGGDSPLEAVVRSIDPQGFTRASALGVEERRVRVHADLVSMTTTQSDFVMTPEADAGLGPGYRVLARFVVWEAANALRVPTAALFRHDDDWAVFVVENGRAVLRPVTIGQEAGLSAEVTGGLEAGDVVIIHPGNEVEAGIRVRREK